LLSSLTLLCYLNRKNVKANSDLGRSWEVYSIEQKGKDHLISGGELKLAVPQSLRKAEVKMEAKKQRKFKEPKRADFE
jgi:hypothetical protein